MNELREWQQEALDKLSIHGSGIIIAATGTGKTWLGLEVIKRNIDKKIIITTPTIALMLQWEEEIKEKLNINVGKVGGGFKEFENITLAVINSVRELEINYDVLILDEIHRYSSDKNILLLLNNDFEKIIGLTATIDDESRLISELDLNIIYRYSQSQAINDNVLCKYNIINVGVELNDKERELYDSYQKKITDNAKKYHINMNEIFGGGYGKGKALIRRMITKRRALINNSINKIIETFKIAKYEVENNNKVIIFCELIKTASSLEYLFKKYNIDYSIYHSQKKEEQNIDDFKNNKTKILISVKSLDEGLNVPDANVGIILAGTSKGRQMIQRLGRLLRKKSSSAKIYQLYARNTKDEAWLKSRLNSVSGYSKITWK